MFKSVISRLARSHRIRSTAFLLGRVVVAPIAVVAVGVLFLIRPVVSVRIYPLGRLWNFGFLCTLPDRVVRNWQIDPPAPGIKHIFLVHSPGNRVLMQMWRRRLSIVESRLVCFLADLAEPILIRTPFFRYDHRATSDGHYLPYSPQADDKVLAPSLSFLPKEEAQGREWLASMGVEDDDWWVCFHNRDDAYYASKYQTVRNCSIDSYMSAAEHIAKLGGFAFRMGADAETPMPGDGDPRVIDYAREHRSEFMDIYLLSKCRFFLGNSSGTFSSALIFNRPIAMANGLSVFSKPSLSAQDHWIPKHIRRIEDGTILTYAQCSALPETMGDAAFGELMSVGHAQGLEFVENSGEDILDLTLDMIDQHNGVKPASEMAERVKAFTRIYMNEDPDRFFGISPRFLERWKSLAPELW